MEKNKLSYRKWIIGTFALMFSCLMIMIGITVFIDPFFQYHKPYTGISYVLQNSDYQNPGIVKNFTYDTIIVGTSMTENFKMDWFEDTEEIIKIPYRGGHSKNFSDILKLAVQHNPNIKRIYWGIDGNYMYKTGSTTTRMKQQKYLFDNYLFNDAEYLINKEVLFSYTIPNIQSSHEKVPSTSFDEYLARQDICTFNMITTLELFDFDKTTDITEEEIIQNVKENLENNILPIIENNQDISFVLFEPPYSVLYYYPFLQENKFEQITKAKEYIASSLLKYSNVEYFVFNEPRILNNLYNYTDDRHYSQDVNYFMTKCFMTKQHLLTEENYKAVLSEQREMIEEFDYSLLDGSLEIFQASTIQDYLCLINDSRYITFFSGRFTEPIQLEESVKEAFEKIDLHPDTAQGYCAVVDGGEVVLEESREGNIEVKYLIEGENMYLISEYREEHPYIEISMEDILPNRISYTINSPGMNIVVYDKILNRIVDNSAFPL